MFDGWEDASHWDEPAPPPSAYDIDRFSSAISYRNGTTLVGVGSRYRYRSALAALEARVERYLDEGPGFGVLGQLFPPTGTPLGSFLRGEIYAGYGLAHWRGEVPGSVLCGLGLGGDSLEVGGSSGRFYGLARARSLVWLGAESSMALSYEVLPAIASPSDLAQHEHRIELEAGVGWFRLGPRAAFTFRLGGEPERGFSEHTFGGFIGIEAP